MKKIEEEKKKRLIKTKKNVMIELRHSTDDEIDDNAVLENDDFEFNAVKEDSGILNVLLSSTGLYIILSLGIFFSMYYALDQIDVKKMIRNAS